MAPQRFILVLIEDNAEQAASVLSGHRLRLRAVALRRYPSDQVAVNLT
jgi:hypothetical protein